MGSGKLEFSRSELYLGKAMKATAFASLFSVGAIVTGAAILATLAVAKHTKRSNEK